MKVAVYSGSFNPLYVGHMAIMEYLTRTAGFDCVYLVVSPQNPFKDASNVLTGAERYAAAVEAVKRHPGLRVRVDDIELGMDPPHYTIRTLDALRRREKDNSFTLVVGADNLRQPLKAVQDPGLVRHIGLDVPAVRRDGHKPVLVVFH